MKSKPIHDPYRNPFHNRFHVPVHSRLDEMQAYTHMVWLKDPAPFDQETEGKGHPRHSISALAGAFVLVLAVIVSVALLAN